MAWDRRDFLHASMGASGAIALGVDPRRRRQALPRMAQDRSPRSLRILVLGGTSFLGPHQVRYALERGHTVSIFTRGQTEPSLFPEAFQQVEHLIGDRNGELEALRGRTWDAVIDNSGRRVEWARDTAQLLKDSVDRYLYVSSTGVYLPYRTQDIREDIPLVLADDPPEDPPSYGVMKSLSEREVQQAFPGRSLVIRPQYIVGPADQQDRFTYWPLRITRGGEVLVPGRKHDPVMLIDVRDLTEWMIRLLEGEVTGVFNAAGPSAHLSMEEFIYGVRAAFTADLSWTWIEDYAFLESQRLTYAIPWVMQAGDYFGVASINAERAIAAGLTFRPLAVTAVDTMAWWLSGAVTAERRASARFPLTAEREAAILSAWAAR
ncbi:MAG TPA: NAD-dependent epimerase/dehydratase family protein [Gemmatimonadales bacterium]